MAKDGYQIVGLKVDKSRAPMIRGVLQEKLPVSTNLFSFRDDMIEPEAATMTMQTTQTNTVQTVKKIKCLMR